MLFQADKFWGLWYGDSVLICHAEDREGGVTQIQWTHAIHPYFTEENKAQRRE